MSLVKLSDGRLGQLDREKKTIKTLPLTDYDLPPFTYHLNDDQFKNRVIRTVGGELTWVYNIYDEELLYRHDHAHPAEYGIESVLLKGSKLTATLTSGEEIKVTVPILKLPKPADLHKSRLRDIGELYDEVVTKIVEQNSKGLTHLDMEYVDILLLKSKLEESGYSVDLENCRIGW